MKGIVKWARLTRQAHAIVWEEQTHRLVLFAITRGYSGLLVAFYGDVTLVERKCFVSLLLAQWLKQHSLLGSGLGYIALSDQTHTPHHYLLFNRVNLILLSELCLLLDTMEDHHTRYSKRLVSNLKQAASRLLPQTLVSCWRAASKWIFIPRVFLCFMFASFWTPTRLRVS